MYYLFDGSYAGLLCCVFESFQKKEFDIIPLTQEEYIGDFFRGHRIIYSNQEWADRVQKALVKNVGASTAMDFFRAYLSEDPLAWKACVYILQAIFKSNTTILDNFGDPEVLYFAQTLKKVSRERHRMKAFVRFNKSTEGLYTALIEPDFNVLPLIVDFFKNRYADQSWLIYDVKRHYGMLYDTQTVQEVMLTTEEAQALSTHTSSIVLDEKDEHFQRLWQHYFQSTNIPARRNIKLHLQWVPKRYWKYLPEKQPLRS